MADFATDYRKGNPDLEIAALDWAILLAPKDTPIPVKFTDASGAIQPLSPLYVPVGNLDKKAGTKLATAINSTPVETYGEQGPTRIIRKNRDTTVDFTMQQTSAVTLGTYWGQDFTAVEADAASGEVNLVISENAFNVEYSLIMIGFDGEQDAEIYTIVDSGRATLSKSGDVTYNDDGIAMYPVTLQMLKHKTLGYATRISYAGPGWKPLASDAGFRAPATSITVHPSTADLVDGEMLQLTVIDNHGVNRTADCTFDSSAPTDATVSATGLVTAVDTGTATITATLGALTDTCSVTVA
ncbi:phage tail tube protein [Nocardia farcinica]|uniref:phage tail tube protein n=1 Tax=Nocardia farcinica TaxID=37329 RepID=UPI0018958E77|nr:Ig-like domain-containing protein [Nocardia farcinica]MBF6411035.1 Ig-like domain-containing protein [Nocardia farcinica]